MTTGRLVDESIEVVDGETIDGVSDDISELQQTLDGEIDAIIAEFGGDDLDNEWKIHVKKVVPNKGTFAHCFSAVPSELPILDRIRDEYGPGDYKVMVYNKNRLRKKPTITIAEPRRKPVTDVIRESKQDLAGVIATLAEQQRETMRMMQTAMVQPQAPAADPMAMMSAMMTAMVQMKEFLAPTQPQGNPVELLVKGVELARDIGGGNGEKNINDTLLGLAKEFGPPLLAMASQEKQSHPQMKPPTGNPPVNPNIQPQAQQQPIDPAFAHQLGMLVQKASTQADPGLYADVICDNADPQQIADIIQRPDLVEYLGSINPGVLQHREWFEKLKKEILSILTGTENDAIQPELNPEMDQVHEAGGAGDFTENS